MTRQSQGTLEAGGCESVARAAPEPHPAVGSAPRQPPLSGVPALEPALGHFS